MKDAKTNSMAPGPKVLYQVPDGSIVPSTTTTTSKQQPQSPQPRQQPIIDFDSISSFVIPRPGFRDRLVSVCTNRYRILGHPICISAPRYDRNELLFNLCIVLEEDEDAGTYITVVRKLAWLFRGLEEQNGFLTRDLIVDDHDGDHHSDFNWASDGRGHRGKVYALCEIILEDLNNYCECMIPIGEFFFFFFFFRDPLYLLRWKNNTHKGAD